MYEAIYWLGGFRVDYTILSQWYCKQIHHPLLVMTIQRETTIRYAFVCRQRKVKLICLFYSNIKRTPSTRSRCQLLETSKSGHVVQNPCGNPG
jgi:hypothetical protein